MRREPGEYVFLDLAMVQEIHAAAIEGFGGGSGIRDEALLESAVAAPSASMAGQPLYGDAVEIAAAYLYFLCSNHPFLDGNKRTALGACIVFLRLNGRTPMPDSPEWEHLTMSIASGVCSREEATARLRNLVANG